MESLRIEAVLLRPGCIIPMEFRRFWAIDQFPEKYTSAKQNANWPRGTREQTRKGYIRSTVIKTLKVDIFQGGVSERYVLYWSRQMRGFMLIG